MSHSYFLLLAGVVLATGSARAQSCAAATNLAVSNITATSATFSYSNVGPGCFSGLFSPATYSYDSLTWRNITPNASPVTLSGLLPGRRVIIRVIRCCPHPFGSPSVVYSAPATIAFTTAPVLATQAASVAEAFTLAPNPARGRATLILGTPVRQATPVLVLDGLGRPVRRHILPAQAHRVELDLADLPAGLYLVRCGAATSRLVVE